MSYQKQSWQSQEVITANKLNHMEEGIKASQQKILVIPFITEGDYYIYNKPWKEIYEVLNNGGYCFVANSTQGVQGINITPLHVWGGDSTAGQIGVDSSSLFVAESSNQCPKQQTNPSN